MKKHNWHNDFINFIHVNKNTQFSWGTNDCVMFAASCIEVCTGEHPFPEHKGKYRTEGGAKKYLSTRFGSLENAWDTYLERIDYKFVQRGDVILFESDTGLTSGISWNSGVYAISPDGIRYFDRIDDRVKGAWRV